MALQYGTTLRNNQVSQIQNTVAAAGTTAMQLRIYSGAQPANCAAAEPAGLLATIVLPAAFLTSSGGVTTIAGVWSVAASGTGTAASWRIYDQAGTPVCHVQGNTTTDLVLNNQSIASGQTVTVTQFSVTAGNA
jgi:hypothetical protein